MNYTDDQQKVIDARDSSLIVSAAAGSGKTAVLVERIIGLITDPISPVDIDRLLVVTFTNAAAAQMREKISRALSARLEDTPDDANLQKQAALIHNARITTIDSFCQYVLRNSFADIDLDPGFRIADEGENKLLEADVLAELVEEYYGREDAEFELLSGYLSPGASDDALMSAVMQVYRTACSDPWPYEWLRVHARDYDPGDGKHLADHLASRIREKARDTVQITLDIYDKALSLADIGGLHESYRAMLAREHDMFGGISSRMNESPDMSIDELCALMGGVEFGRLPSAKAPDEDRDIRAAVKSLRDRAKGAVSGLIDTYLSETEETAVAHIGECSSIISALCSFTAAYMDALEQAKADRGILSFNDCEHRALDILVRRTGDGTWEYTDTAAEYRSYFSYVFIDEYQDSNLIQELILSSVAGESDGVYNRFMVGDVKQSIYRFRQAEPAIFMERYHEYSPESDAKRRRIDLNMNFRSRRAVLDACNALFERVMTEASGGADYDENASLKYGADYTDPDDPAYMTEMIFTDVTEAGGAADEEAEAEAMALRIAEIADSGMMVKDPDDGHLRPVDYGDIVILYRSNIEDAQVYKSVLEKHSIPVTLTGGSGYFDTYEISILMNLLRIICNPLQDIPFYGTMESVIGGFEASEIAVISAAYRASLPEGVRTGEGYLYPACRYVCDEEPDSVPDELRERVRVFTDRLARYREMSVYLDVSELLALILDETGYRVLMMAMRGGPGRVANVDMLIRKAADYSSTSYFGLYNFIRYIDTLVKTDAREESAEIPSGTGGMVRIMTAHKSKGLEFPVVFVARLGNRFNMQDASGTVICDHKKGIGIRNFDAKRRIRYSNLMYRYVSDEIRSQTLAEEMRILYVSMTRAREKLILMCTLKAESGAADDAEEQEPVMRIKRPDGLNRYADWYLQCLCDVQGTDAIEAGYAERDIDELKIKYYRSDISGMTAQAQTESSAISSGLLLAQLQALAPVEDAYSSYLSGLYDYEYPHPDLRGLYTKTSVSVLKHAAMPDDVAVTDTSAPREASAHELIPGGATARGSAFHRIMELFDFTSLHNTTTGTSPAPDIPALLAEAIDSYAADGRIAPEQKRILDDPRDRRLIETFLASDTARRMAAAQAAGALYREAPFMMGISASLVDERFPAEETVLIQGIIDVYWIEDGRAQILDYKTDRVSEASRLIELYKTQLDLYGRALEQMHIPVGDRIIYSFALGETIVLEDTPD